MNSVRGIFSSLLKLGADPADSADTRRDKRLLIASVLLILPAGVVWGWLYILFGAPLAGILPLLYSALSLLNLVLFGVTRRYKLFRFNQLLLILLVPWLLMIVLGGFISSSAVILWGMLNPIGALIFASPRAAVRWFLTFAILLVLGALLQPFLQFDNQLPQWLITVFFVMNIGVPSTIVFVLLRDFVNQLQHVNHELARLSSFPELNPSAIIEIDLAGSVHYMNPAAVALFPEGDRSELRGFFVADLLASVPMLRDLGRGSYLRERKIDAVWYQQVMHMVPSGDRVRSFILDITERKKADEALQRQNDYLAALHATTLGLMSRLDLNEVLQAIVARAGQLLGTPHGFIFLLEPGEEQMEQKVGVGIFAQTIGLRVKRGEGASGQVWESGQPVVVADYRDWKHRALSYSNLQIVTVAAVPLKSGDQVVGTIGLAYVSEADQKFGDPEMELLSRFAELASLALDNARLFAQTQDQARRLALLNEMGQQMSLAASQDEIFQVGTSFAPQIVPADHVSVALLAEDEDVLEVHALKCALGVMPVGTRWPLEGSLSGQAIREERLVNTPNLADTGATDATELARAGLRSAITAPLIFGERVIGVLRVGSGRPNMYQCPRGRPGDADRLVPGHVRGEQSPLHGSPGGARGGHRRRHGQERVPGQHEPRDPHAHERHHRHDGPAAGHRTRSGAGRVRRDHPQQRRGPADDHQRHPRFLEDRSRQARPGEPTLRSARLRRRRARSAGRQGGGEAPGSGLPHCATHPGSRRGGRDAAAADPGQPAQ